MALYSCNDKSFKRLELKMYKLILIIWMLDGTAVLERDKKPFKSSVLCHWEGSRIAQENQLRMKKQYPGLKRVAVYCGYRYQDI